MVTKTLFRQFPGVQSCRLFLDAAAGMGDDDGGILQGGIKPVGKIDEGRHRDTLGRSGFANEIFCCSIASLCRLTPTTAPINDRLHPFPVWGPASSVP